MTGLCADMIRAMENTEAAINEREDRFRYATFEELADGLIEAGFGRAESK